MEKNHQGNVKGMASKVGEVIEAIDLSIRRYFLHRAISLTGNPISATPERSMMQWKDRAPLLQT
jgi:hypothetical protein